MTDRVPHTAYDRILRAEILSNPFPDIKPRRIAKSADDEKKSKKKSGPVGRKDTRLLSFGEEAEAAEAELAAAVREEKKVQKAKSAHDALDDPRLLKVGTCNRVCTYCVHLAYTRTVDD